MSEYPDDKEREDKKRLLMKVGVWSFSIILAVVWLVSLQFSVSSDKTVNEDVDSWQKEFSETISQIKGDFTNADDGKQDKTEDEKAFLEGLKEDVEKIASSTESGTPTSTTATITPDMMIDELERRLSASSTTPVSSSTQPVTPPKNNCPEYINCMPTFGEARPCVIPPGCENYTQIAY